MPNPPSTPFFTRYHHPQTAKILRNALLLALCLGLPACELLYFIAGKGDQSALHEFSKNEHVLVFVDVKDNVTPPPDFTVNLANKIGTHLITNKAVQFLVSQDGLSRLQSDPDHFKTMGIADIAQATGADSVVVITVKELATPSTSDGLVTEGRATIYVKVVDRTGAHIWPGDPEGEKVYAQIQAALASDRSKEAIVKEMTDLLAVRAGRMFHSYNLENKEMIR